MAQLRKGKKKHHHGPVDLDLLGDSVRRMDCVCLYRSAPPIDDEFLGSTFDIGDHKQVIQVKVP